MSESSAFLAAVAEVAPAIGVEVLGADEELAVTDVPLRWKGEIVAHLRPAQLHGSLQRLIDAIEADLGASLDQLDRQQKQAAVRILDDQGAFLLRGAVEFVAERIGVSRITVYNYLTAIARADEAASAAEV
ncbi:helix-turn-helix domain-containing protein [soil metagenome]